MAALYIVATPIGNLKDVTLRALEVLRGVDLILAEDTRITKRLLEHYDIKKPILSYHQHSELKKINYILELLREGKNLALVSDAGTPGISDPGNKLVSEVLKDQKLENIKIVPIPGSSVLAAVASISGLSMERFLFLGFPPAKKKRKRFFDQILNSKYPVIFYESPYRILRTLSELKDISPERNIIVCRELTKKFETIYRGRIDEVIKKISVDQIKGEFVVII